MTTLTQVKMYTFRVQMSRNPGFEMSMNYRVSNHLNINVKTSALWKFLNEYIAGNFIMQRNSVPVMTANR